MDAKIRIFIGMESLAAYLTQFIPTDISVITEKFHLRELERNDYFVHEGKSCRELAFIETGSLRIYAQTDDKEVTQWISSPGYFITELSSFFFDTPARWNIQALTDCRLWSIRREDHRALCEAVPAWNQMDKLFIAKCFTMLEDRIFSHLHESAEQRFQRLMQSQPALFNQVPLQYIASMLGMTPETLSRLRKQLS